MTDPYKILGVPHNATDDEIKKAYRALVKKYHPDNYQDSALSELAAEKMKEINEAYDEILRQRQQGSSSSGTDSGMYGFPKIRQLINEGRYSEAELSLDSVSLGSRTAEWHYLKAIVLLRRGWVYDAQNHIDTACSMDPSNEEYRQFKYQLSRNANAYGGSYRTTDPYGCSGCDVCSSLLCADCLCECCGGDLIRCC